MSWDWRRCDGLSDFLEPRLQDGISDRQEQNGVLFKAYFDKPDLRDAMQAWVTERLYRNIWKA